METVSGLLEWLACGWCSNDLCSADNHSSWTPVNIAWNYFLLVVIPEDMPVLKVVCEAVWSVEGLYWNFTVLGSGEMEMFALWLRWASHREQHELVSDWKLLLQCVCTHVSIQCHWSAGPVGKAEGTEIIRVEKGNFWEEMIVVFQ